MIKYSYQIIKYTHDLVTGEFVNVGVVLFEPNNNFIEAKVLNKFSRISNFFGEVNGHFLLSRLKHFQKEIVEISKNKSLFSVDHSIDSITSRLIPKDDSSLQLSEMKFGLDLSPINALNDLYKRLVEKYIDGNSQEARTDNYAWNKVYKQYFDQHGITAKLRDHTVQTNNDKIKFDKSWKNGVWNCYQTLSLDLKKEDNIRGKIYKWSGIVRELETASEKMNLFFLTTKPKSESKKLNSFIKETLSLNTDCISVKIVSENDAAAFAEEVKKAMIKSDVL